MLDDIAGSLPIFARQALPISLVAWVAIQLVYQSIRQGGGFLYEGIYTFLGVWGLITAVSYHTNGRSLAAISAFAYSLLAIGAFVSLIRVIMWLISPKRRSG